MISCNDVLYKKLNINLKVNCYERVITIVKGLYSYRS